MILDQTKEGKSLIPKAVLIFLIIGFVCSFFLSLDYFAHSEHYILQNKEIYRMDSKSISTKVHVGKPFGCITKSCWAKTNYDDSTWKPITLPYFSLKNIPSSDEIEPVYYRLKFKIPEALFNSNFPISFTPSYIHLKDYQIHLNGHLIYEGTGSNHVGGFPHITLPRELLSSQNVLLSISGLRSPNDVGIYHGTGLYLGRHDLVGALALRNERITITLHLFWLLTIGTICIFFSLLYLFSRKRKVYVNVILYTFCFFLVELMRSDFVSPIINLHSRLYIIAIAKSIGVVALLRFFIGYYRRKVDARKLILLGSLLLSFSIGLVSLFLFSNTSLKVFDIFQFFRLLGLFSYIYVFILSLSDRRRFSKVFSLFLLSLSIINIWILVEQSLFYEPALDLIMSFFISISTIRQFGRDEETILIQTKKLQNQARDVAIGQTASSMLHDIRRPYSQMLALVNNIDQYKNDTQLLNRAESEVRTSMKRVEEMISEVMDFSRETTLETTPMNINPIIEDLLNDIKKSHPDISFEFLNEGAAIVPLSKGKIIRSLQNILVNAVEAIQIMGSNTSGRVWIKNKLIETRSNSYIQIDICNNGPKFDLEKVDNVFDPFFSKGKEEGTGIGLASVKKSIELHNGQIKAFNLENEQGVCFQIQLPIEKTEQSIKTKSFKIYFCDDSELIRISTKNIIEEVLKKLDLNEVDVLEFANGEELIKAYENEKSDLVISDYYMEDSGGKLNGIQVLKRIKDMNNDCQLYLSSNKEFKNDEGDLITGFLKPPLGQEQIEKIIRAYLMR